jgi:AAA domain
VKLSGYGIFGVRRDFVEGLESFFKTIRQAAVGQKEQVFTNMANDAASFICEGGFKQDYLVERFNDEARSLGLEPNAKDLIDRALVSRAKKPSEDKPMLPDQNRLKPILWSYLDKLPKREALVEGLLHSAALSVLFGPSGCGKTFFALDLAAHIALGWPWRGRSVLQGAVVYVAAEGGYGIHERLEAFKCHHGIDLDDFPFYVIPEPIDLCNSDADVDLLLWQLKSEIPKGQLIHFMVVDTVSRALAGGNENSPDHMGGLVRRCDKARTATGAHLMLAHHTGKDTSQGARGHSLLRAAVDTEIEMTWDKEAESGLAKVTKQRDSRTEGRFAFRLEQYDVDFPANGKPVTSCVVVPTEAEHTHTSQEPDLPTAARKSLAALAKAIEDNGQSAPALEGIPEGQRTVTKQCWREYAYKAEISTKGQRAKEQAFKRAMECLMEAGRIGRRDDLVWLNSEPPR